MYDVDDEESNLTGLTLKLHVLQFDSAIHVIEEPVSRITFNYLFPDPIEILPVNYVSPPVSVGLLTA